MILPAKVSLLEVLETMNVIGDRGLEVLAQCCRKLKRLKMESGRHAVVVSHRGLSALSHGCQELEYIGVYVTNITNAALAHIGTKLQRLCDFCLVLLGREKVADFPLDKGVRDLLRGCKKLRRFALCLRPGGLTDVGLRYIGKYSLNVRWMLLGGVGETDAGLLEFSKGCPSLQKLEMMGCSIFSKHALATAATKLTSLRYLWVQGYGGSTSGGELMAMARPYWNVELIRDGRQIDGRQILGYYSLAGPRSDFPATVELLDPATASLDIRGSSFSS